MSLTSVQLNIERLQGSAGEPTSAFILTDSGDGVTYLLTFKAAIDPSYPSLASSITQGSPIEVAVAGSSAPGGLNTQLQYNNNGSLGGITGATTDGNIVTITTHNLVVDRPKISTSIDDANGNKILGLNPVNPANSFVQITNSPDNAPAVVHVAGAGIAGSVTLSLESKGSLGIVQISPGTDSVTAFQVQKHAGTVILNVDSTNSRVGIGTVAPGFTLDVNGTLDVSGASSFAAAETITISDNATNTVTQNLVLIHNSGGAVAAGFGSGIRIGLQDSTTPNQDAGLLYASWTTATHATRSSQVAIQAVDQATALADVAQFSFQHNGGSPVAQIVIVGTQGQANVPQLAPSNDLQSGLRLSGGNIFFVGSGADNIQFVGGTAFMASLVLSFANNDVRLTRTGAAAARIDNNAGGAASLAVTGVINGASITGPPAGGSAAAFLALGTTAGFGIYFGSGAPTVSAAQGSIYLRTDGSSAITRAYVNTNGAGTWTAFSTVL